MIVDVDDAIEKIQQNPEISDSKVWANDVQTQKRICSNSIQ